MDESAKNHLLYEYERFVLQNNICSTIYCSRGHVKSFLKWEISDSMNVAVPTTFYIISISTYLIKVDKKERRRTSSERIEDRKMKEVLFQFLFPLPPSLFVKFMSVFSLGYSADVGLSEIRGKNLQYSKFWNVNSHNQSTTITTETKVSSKTGMLIIYTPAFVAAIYSLGSNHGIRFMLVDAALTLYFFKRIIEVLFVHRYSGRIVLSSAIPISLGNFVYTTTMIHDQHLTDSVPEPWYDLKGVGVLLFLFGILGNFFHHCLLAELREGNDKRYKIPKGNMFNLVICPHYLFEIFSLAGISFISQTVYSVSSTIGTTFYLMARSYATRSWYMSKFPNFPKNVKRILPYVF